MWLEHGCVWLFLQSKQTTKLFTRRIYVHVVLHNLCTFAAEWANLLWSSSNQCALLAPVRQVFAPCVTLPLAVIVSIQSSATNKPTNLLVPGTTQTTQERTNMACQFTRACTETYGKWRGIPEPLPNHTWIHLFSLQNQFASWDNGFSRFQVKFSGVLCSSQSSTLLSAWLRRALQSSFLHSLWSSSVQRNTKSKQHSLASHRS